MNNRSLFPGATSASTAALALALTLAFTLCAAGSARAASGVAAPSDTSAMPATLGEPVARAPASTPPPVTRTDAFVECESAVGASLRELRGSSVQGVQFASEARAGAGAGEQVDVKGSGHYRRGGGPLIEFRYGCAFDKATGTTSGVVLHEADERPPAALPVWQADLSKLSPQACESAVATRLQSTHARASGIVFDGDDRKLEPGRDGRTALAGSGRLVRAPGMQPGPFRYRCEFDSAGVLADANASD